MCRIDTVPALPTLDRAALLRAAAGLLSQADPAALTPSGGHATGSGVFLLASMLNHSCEPNLDVVFPHNNAVRWLGQPSAMQPLLSAGLPSPY